MSERGGGDGRDQARRRFALEAGIFLQVHDLPALRELAVGDPDPSVRRAAVWSLGRFARIEDLDLMLAALDDDVPAVRSVAGWALWRLGEEAVAALDEVAEWGVTSRHRQHARRVAVRIRRESLRPPTTNDTRPYSSTTPRPRSASEPDGVWVERAVHDLINILQGLVGELDGIATESGIPGEVRDRLEAAEDSSRFLLEVGGSLLDAGRLEGVGETVLSLDTVDLVALAREAAFRGRPPGDRDRVKVLAGAEPIEIRTDRTRLLRVVLNLVWNACKYSRAGDPVRLLVRQHSDGSSTLEVRDRGPGIPHDERSRVLEAFRTGARTVGPGWGLGLSTAVRLLRQIGGRLDIEDRSVAGSVIRLRLPSDPLRSNFDESGQSAASIPPSSESTC